MIKIVIDEAEAFDRLSINENKLNKLISGTKRDFVFYQNNLLITDIKAQIGDLFYKVFASEEYKELYEVNSRLYDAVDLAKKDEILASAVDKLVYLRFLCKKKIQEKYFGNDIQEVKIGYDKKT